MFKLNDGHGYITSAYLVLDCGFIIGSTVEYVIALIRRNQPRILECGP